MKKLLAAAIVSIPAMAFAQTAQRPTDANTQALGQEVLDCVNAKIGTRTQLIEAQGEIAALKTQLAAAEAKAKPTDQPPAAAKQ